MAGGAAAAGAIGGGLLSAAGPIIGSAMQAATNKKLQKRAQEWQYKMLRSHNQIVMKDLRDAGLNPILTALGGGGLGTGGSGSVSSPTVGLPQFDIAGGIQRGISTAKQLKAINDELRTVKAQADTAQNVNERTKAEIDRTQSEAEVNWKTAYNIGWRNVTAEQTFWKTKAERAIMEAMVPHAKRTGAVYEGPIGELLSYIEAITRSAGFHSGAGVHHGTGKTDITHRKGRFNRK